MSTRERKVEYLAKVEKIFGEYTKALVVHADNVGSTHFQNIRRTIRKGGETTILMGKNTLIRKAIRDLIESTGNNALDALVPHLKGNVGLVLTKGDLSEVRKTIETLRVAAPAKVGAIAPVDVLVPKGDTGLEPTQTAFLQALNIPTKINKGQIQILDDKIIITKGQKVGNSEATLCQKLKILPFTYGLNILQVYDDGSIYEPAVLDVTDDQILKRFSEGIQNIASLSLAIGVPTSASIPHSISNAYKNIVAIAIGSEWSFARVQELKDLLDNPEALAAASAAAAAPVAAAAAAPAAAAAAAPAAAAKDEDEDEDGDMGFGLFD